MLVDQLIQECRDGIDEDDTADVSDAKILRALNRAQLKLARLAVRKYPPLFRREHTATGVSTREVEIPETSYAFVVNEVSVRAAGSSQWSPCDRASESSLTGYDNDSASALPKYWDQAGTAVRLYPRPSGSEVRIRYQLRPPDLVAKQGRITSISGQTVYLDAIGSDLTTSIAQLKAFVNFVDASTGAIKSTMQVSVVPATIAAPLQFKSSSLDRTTVFGQTVSTTLDTDVAVDDYVCIANGTCVPTLLSDYSDYLVLAAVIELRRAAGEDASAEVGQLKEIEDDVKAMWAGRAAGLRVARKNPYWGVRTSMQQRFRD